MEEREREWISKSSPLDSPTSKIIVAHHHRHCVRWASFTRPRSPELSSVVSSFFFFLNRRPAAQSRLDELIGRFSPPKHLTAYLADFFINLGAAPTPSA